MDIHSKSSYPSGALSNFAPHPFTIDGVECASMEGFLQSLKFRNPDMQEHVCTLTGSAAKRAGANKNWRRTQTLYWRGKAIRRDSRAYQALLDRAFAALGENSKFEAALRASGSARLTHSLGKKKKADTVLTTQEFVSRLTALRDNLE